MWAAAPVAYSKTAAEVLLLETEAGRSGEKEMGADAFEDGGRPCYCPVCWGGFGNAAGGHVKDLREHRVEVVARGARGERAAAAALAKRSGGKAMGRGRDAVGDKRRPCYCTGC